MITKKFFAFLVLIFSVNLFSGFAAGIIKANNPAFQYSGRVASTIEGAMILHWSGTAVYTIFEGTSLSVKLENISKIPGVLGHSYYNIFIDGELYKVLESKTGVFMYEIASDLKEGQHRLEIYKRTEPNVGIGKFYGIKLDKGANIIPEKRVFNIKIEFIGNSITCGYGVEGDSKDCDFTPDTENHSMSFAGVATRILNAEQYTVAYSGKGLTVNYGGGIKETVRDLYPRTQYNEADILWDFSKWIPDIVVINLGTNDFSHKNPIAETWIPAYVDFVKSIKKNYPEAKIILLSGPMTSDYYPAGNKALSTLKTYLDTIATNLSELYPEAIYRFDFKTQGALGYGCDWHPSAEQQALNGRELAEFIQQIKEIKK